MKTQRHFTLRRNFTSERGQPCPRVMKIRHARTRLSALLLLLLLSTLNYQPSTFAQGTAFTYHGQLNDGGRPANGSYDLQFAVFISALWPIPLAGPVTNAATALSNGFFAVTLDFGEGVFTGADRWLEIAVRTNGAASFTTVSPRQKLTATPYSITAINVTGPINGGSIVNGTITSAQLAAGAVNSSNIANSSITAAKLAPNAAAANLSSIGQSAVAAGGIVLSENPNNTSLVDAGYVRIGKVDLIPEHWEGKAAGPPGTGILMGDRWDHSAVWTGTEMIIWGGYNGAFLPKEGWTVVEIDSATMNVTPVAKSFEEFVRRKVGELIA